MSTGFFSGPQDEADARRIATNDGLLGRARMALVAGLRLARDPTDTLQVFYLSIAVDVESLPHVADALRRCPSGRELIQRRAAIDSGHVDFAQLRALPAGTLGGAYVRALDSQGLDPDVFQRPPGLPEEVAYVAQRIRQTHDLWHVITGLETDIPGEVALQAFTHAQLGLHFSLLITRFGLLFYGLRYPRMWRMVRSARRAGRAASFLLATHWEDHWAQSLAELREQLGVESLERYRLAPA